MGLSKRSQNWLDAANPGNPGYHKSYPFGTVYTWDYSDLTKAIPPELASQWDLALESMGTSGRITKVMAAITATRVLLANAIRKVRGDDPTSSTAAAGRWFAEEAGGTAGKAVGTALGGAVALALAGPITAASTAVATSVGVTAAAGVELGAGVALGAVTAGIGAVAVVAAVAIADAVVSAFDHNCCDNNNCDWSFDFRFGGGQEVDLGLFGEHVIINKEGQQSFPNAQDIAWDKTLQTFAYVVSRLDWDAQAAIAGKGCPGPDLGAGPLLAACLLGAWNRANAKVALAWDTTQPGAVTYALSPNEPGGSTFKGAEGFAILLIGMAVQEKLGGNDIVQFQVRGLKMANDPTYSAAEALDEAVQNAGGTLNLKQIKINRPANAPKVGATAAQQPPHIRRIVAQQPGKPADTSTTVSKTMPILLGGGGAAAGFAVGGPLGALVGAVLGAVVGSKV